MDAAPSADRPLRNVADDRYGFAELARRLASAIEGATKGAGLVIGIEGAWGVGKTTLLRFLEVELGGQDGAEVRIITLAPWMQGDRANLVADLMAQLDQALDAEDEGRCGMQGLTEAERNALRDYTLATARGARGVLKLAGLVMPGAALAGELLEQGTKLAETVLQGPSVLELKERIRGRIEASGLRFVVLVDDLDRLEPAQAAEVVRLVRSVADFPRMVYVLCYDRAVLGRALERSLEVESGDRFLQKVVQLAFPMPAFEPFELRGELRTQLQDLYAELEEQAIEGEAARELRRAVGDAGAAIQVPRDVVHIVSAVRFAWLASRDETYFPDVCRVQIIRATQPELYLWLEEYLAVHSVVATGSVHVPESDKGRLGEELRELLPDEDPLSANSIATLGRLVPGIVQDDDPAKRVFRERRHGELEELIEGKRLGSPVHHRAYFAFATPKTVLSDRRFAELTTAARKDHDALRELFLEAARSEHPTGGTWLDHILDRFRSIHEDGMDDDQLAGTLRALGNVMDDALGPRAEAPALTMGRQLKDRASGLFHLIACKLAKRDAERASAVLLKVAREGQALSWLVGFALHDEIAVQGTDAPQASEETEPVMTPDDQEAARAALLARIAEKSVDELLSVPELRSFLRGWMHLAGKAPVAEWGRQQAMASDEAFLTMFLSLRHHLHSDRHYRPLAREHIEVFMDCDEAVRRLGEIAERSGEDADPRIGALREAIEVGGRSFP